MRKIAVLDQNTIDKIAAGEVVERPSSVVKELVENAIDADATAITVEIKEGGKKLIRITDNGTGLEKEQVPLAFYRHATSKIKQVEDLEHIASLGFRGEALSSIAAVSQVELITKTHTAISGVRYLIEGGLEKSLEEIGAPDGTTLLVRNLFFNTPARSKFLKSDTTEAGYISSLMEQLALSHPEISFKYIQNGQVKLHTTGNYQVKDVIFHIYGREVAKELLEVQEENEFMKIQGYIGKPGISRGNRYFENYYINGRYVKDKIITKAIEDAYKGFLMQHQFPFVSLQITMEGNDLDVNVHPSKREVRFARGPEVYRIIFETVTRALKEREMIPEVNLDTKEERLQKKKEEAPPVRLTRGEVPEPFETKRKEALNQNVSAGKVSLLREEPSYPVRKETGEKPRMESPKAPDPKPEEKQMELFDSPLLTPKARDRHRLVGQLFDTYWLVEYGEKFYIIDQHAAHEKVYYERFVKQFASRKQESQYLNPPLVVSLNLQEEERLKANLSYFQESGFEIEPFGGREYRICAVPVNLYGLTEQDIFLEMLDHLSAEEEPRALEIFTGRLATMACKAAVKGNHQLSVQEANALIDELLSLENPYHCPHGRPTIISMTKTELEKKFKRIV